jgi:hypothetical protein
MFSWFSKLIDRGVDAQFRKDSSGQLVFLPSFGANAYFVDSQSDQDKIRGFVKMYQSASMLMSWMSTLISCIWITSIPLQVRMTHLVATGFAYMLVPIASILILWGVYKQTIPSLISSLREVGPDVKGQLTEISTGRLRRVLLCLGAGLLLLGLILLLLVQRPSGRSGTCLPQGEVSQQPQVDSTHRPCVEQP